MSKRQEQLEQLSAYLDGELDDAERRDVEALLGSDPEARSLLDGLRQTSQLLGTLPRGTAPTGLAVSVTAKLERRELLGDSDVSWMGKAGRTVSWSSRLAVAASIGLVCTAGWLGWYRTSEVSDAPKFAVGTDAPAESVVESNGELANGKSFPGDSIAGNTGLLAGEAIVSAGEKRVESAELDSTDSAMEIRGDSVRSRAGLEVSKAGSPDRSEETRLDLPATPVAVAGSLEHKDNFDAQLAAETMSNDVLRQVSFGLVSNTVEVLADEPTQRAMAGVVTKYATKQKLPMVGQQQLVEPISQNQAFVFRGEPAINYRPAADQYEDVYLLNVPEEDVKALLLEVQNAAGESPGSMSVVANGQSVEDLNVAGDVVLRAFRGGTRYNVANSPEPASPVKPESDKTMTRRSASSDLERDDIASAADEGGESASAIGRDADRAASPMKKSVRTSEDGRREFEGNDIDESRSTADGEAARGRLADRSQGEKDSEPSRFAGTSKPADPELLGDLRSDSSKERKSLSSPGRGGQAVKRPFVALTLAFRRMRDTSDGSLRLKSVTGAPSARPTTQTTQPDAHHGKPGDPSRGG